MPTRFLIGLAAVMTALAGMTNDTAAQDQDQAHWFVFVDAALTQPSPDLEYALQIDNSGFPVASTRHLIEPDTTFSFRAGFGRDFGRDKGSMRVSFWGIDTEDTVDDRMAGYVQPLVFGQGYYGRYYYLENPTGVTTTAESSIKATVVDLDYRRAMAQGRKFRVNWIVGLRVSNYQQEVSFSGDDQTLYIVEQSKEINSSAYGVRVGAEARFDFGRTFRFEADLGISGLISDLEARAAQAISDPNGTLLYAESAMADDESAIGQIIDVGARGVWRVGRSDIVLGLTFSQWNGIAEDRLPPVPFGADREAVAFTSVSLGWRWRFLPKP